MRPGFQTSEWKSESTVAEFGLTKKKGLYDRLAVLFFFFFLIFPSAIPGRGDAGASEFSIDGYIRMTSGVNFAHDSPGADETDYRGLSKLKAELYLESNLGLSGNWQCRVSGKGDYDTAYALNGRKGYTSEVLRRYESDLELREAWLTGRLAPSLDIKVGRQIVAWGKSDTIRITDVLNPMDMREPGLTDLKDLRLPLTMTKLDYYAGNWDLSAIAIHEIRFDRNPAFGSDFYPYSFRLPPEDKPENGWENTEFGVSMKGTFSAWDISLYFADIYWDTPYVRFAPTLSGLQPELAHAEVRMPGIAFNAALGNWIVKGEGAYIDGLRYCNRPEKTYSRSDVLAGLEYYGFDDMVMILEIACRHINGFDSVLKQSPDEARENEFQYALRIARTFIHETLEIEGLFSCFGFDGRDGGFQRLSATYDLTDTLEIKAGAMLYQSGDMPGFGGIGENDRFFAEVKYSF